MTVITTYLGEKGYSIYKKEMTVNEQQFIRDELTVRPYLPGSQIKLDAFPYLKLWREEAPLVVDRRVSWAMAF